MGEKIPLKDISTIKSFHKNQYERGLVFRIESEDNYFYLSGVEHQEKWAWITAIEKMTEMLKNPNFRDTQNLVRESIKVMSALRTSQERTTLKQRNSH